MQYTFVIYIIYSKLPTEIVKRTSKREFEETKPNQTKPIEPAMKSKSDLNSLHCVETPSERQEVVGKRGTEMERGIKGHMSRKGEEGAPSSHSYVCDCVCLDINYWTTYQIEPSTPNPRVFDQF